MTDLIRSKTRFYSLDVFRGATVALMILVNNPGSWSNIYSPLDHAEWHGLTPTDLVFPFFLFAVGNAFAFVMPHLQAAGHGAFWKKIIKRFILIFAIGLVLNWLPFVRWQHEQLSFIPWSYMDNAGDVKGVRIMGVLQRIAIAYFLAAIIIYFFKIRGSYFIACILLLGYWLLCNAMNPSDPYSISGWFGTGVDKAVLHPQHMYHGEVRDGIHLAFDPEGLMSSFTPVAQVIFGYLCGDYIIRRGKTPETVNGLFVAGTILLVASYVWNFTFPINKKIWTSSYVLCTTGMAMIIIAVIIYFIELKEKRSWPDRFFNVFGKNPLFIFVLSGFLPRFLGLVRISSGTDATGQNVYITPLNWFYQNVCMPVFPGSLKNGSLLYALVWIMVMWLIVFWMDKKKIYIRI